MWIGFKLILEHLIKVFLPVKEGSERKHRGIREGASAPLWSLFDVFIMADW